MNIGKRLKITREKRKISQEELSKLSGIPRTSLGRYERGERIPNIETLEKISIALQVPLILLIGEMELIKDSNSNDLYSKQLILFETDTINQMITEENIIKYILNKIDDTELKNITLNNNEMSQLFDFILISSNVKIRELIKHREKRTEEKK